MCLRGCTTISIHPMLFFILYGCNVMADLYRFQYILCYFLSQKNSWNDMTGCISIHPMLFFINTGSNAYLRASNFNTSYVIFYPCCLQSHCFCGSNFNTSYVIFYRGNEVVVIFCQWFQYILCYFLSWNTSATTSRSMISIHPMLFFIGEEGYVLSIDNPYFNTSYVIFYRIWSLRSIKERVISIHPMLFFITGRSKNNWNISYISIHPMLFFIGKKETEKIMSLRFQYILCYFLSNTFNLW